MKNLMLTVLVLFVIVACNQPVNKSNVNKENKTEISTAHSTNRYNKKTNATIAYKKINIDGVNVAYREAGNPNNPTIVLLHGFPASSHQYRKVLTQLSDEFHLVAPDYPGFGNSDFPSKKEYTYTFDNLAKTINTFLEKKGLTSYALMIQDYGAPIGFRIATAHPERVLGIINQNGNAYEEGLGEAWAGIRALWANRNADTEAACLPAFSLEGLEWQYTHGTRNKENVNPDNWNLDYLRLSRPGAHEVNIDLFYDYQNNLTLYPKWQKYLRDNQPPLLIVWGKNDLFFPESGAVAFKKDVKNIDYNIYNTGHFALEEDGNEIIQKMRTFVRKL
ncbi:alpha/beta fold hydrolase [Aquimarina spongiae]|nr:alpha/beta hydrolase [Aquimarina spongiae]